MPEVKKFHRPEPTGEILVRQEGDRRHLVTDVGLGKLGVGNPGFLAHALPHVHVLLAFRVEEDHGLVLLGPLADLRLVAVAEHELRHGVTSLHGLMGR